MARTAIVTSQPEVACEICARRLLRGERPQRFHAHGELYVVCELCTDRAREAGWVRENELDASIREPYARHRRRPTLRERLRRRRGRATAHEPLDSELRVGYDSPR